jgi:hypothetical protein
VSKSGLRRDAVFILVMFILPVASGEVINLEVVVNVRAEASHHCHASTVNVEHPEVGAGTWNFTFTLRELIAEASFEADEGDLGE